MIKKQSFENNLPRGSLCLHAFGEVAVDASAPEAFRLLGPAWREADRMQACKPTARKAYNPAFRKKCVHKPKQEKPGTLLPSGRSEIGGSEPWWRYGISIRFSMK